MVLVHILCLQTPHQKWRQQHPKPLLAYQVKGPLFAPQLCSLLQHFSKSLNIRPVPSQFVALVAMIRTFLWAYNHATGGSTTVPLLASTPLNSHPHHHSEKQYMIPSHTHALTPSPQPPAPPFRNTTHDPPTSPLTLPHPNLFLTATHSTIQKHHHGTW